MSDIKEFLDVLNGEWTKSQNLKKFGIGFGTYDYVARVLEVIDLDGETQEEQRQSDAAAQENDKSKNIKRIIIPYIANNSSLHLAL